MKKQNHVANSVKVWETLPHTVYNAPPKQFGVFGATSTEETFFCFSQKLGEKNE